MLTTTSTAAFALSIAPDDPRLKPATVRSMNNAGFSQVFIDGYIHAPTVDAFEKIVSNNPESRGIVYFNSDGGDIRAAMKLGRLLRANGYATHIGKLTDDGSSVRAGTCASACPIAFIGGEHRLLQTDTGNLAVHQFYQAKPEQTDTSRGLMFTIRRDLKAYIEEMGISSEFYDLISSTPADQIVTVGKEAEYHWNLRSNQQKQSWTAGAGEWVSGHKTSVLGDFELKLECTDGSATATVGFKPWFPSVALLNFDTHSFLIDSQAWELQSVTASYDEKTGIITFRTELSPDIASAIRESNSVGYTLSLDGQFGNYSQVLNTPRAHDDFDAFWNKCTNLNP